MNPYAYLTSPGATGWLQIALFVAIVYVRIAKPDMIRSLMLYRWASTALVLSILVPVVFRLSLVFFYPETVGMSARVMRNNPYGFLEMTPYGMLGTATGPILLSVGLFCFFAALAPRIARESQPKPTAPAQQAHPLD